MTSKRRYTKHLRNTLFVFFAFYLLSGRFLPTRILVYSNRNEVVSLGFGGETDNRTWRSVDTFGVKKPSSVSKAVELYDRASDILRKEQVNVSAAFEAMFVFTMIRHDLLDLHLGSIDYPIKHLFVIVNFANKVIMNDTLSVLEKYRDCNETAIGLSRNKLCRNHNIRTLYILSYSHNVGFAGSCNVGIKAMIEFDLSYALFSGDDTRFLPQRIKEAKLIIESSPSVCMFHLEGYSSFAITRRGAQRIGPFDENFWPAYAEDCDYWFRALLVGCPLFYRGGYSPEKRLPQNMQNVFVQHGDTKDTSILGSVTHKSNPSLGRLVEGTLDATRGRFAYLIRKWGFNTCDYYHKVITKWRDDDEILSAPGQGELAAQKVIFFHPYNDSSNFSDIRRWIRDDWRKEGAISSRAVNYLHAPADMVWQEADFTKLGMGKHFD